MDCIVLSGSPRSARWADVFTGSSSTLDAPNFRVRVFEKEQGTDLRRSGSWLLISSSCPKAWPASRIKQRAKIFAYKDIEFRRFRFESFQGDGLSKTSRARNTVPT
ncbi:DUF5086 family protein [Agrobacterium deltaense]|uniref:DUF5086 family protein n=1 Tax=Agrobacterium deltaense TaxID=1183412 RepID=UPI003D961E21